MNIDEQIEFMDDEIKRVQETMEEVEAEIKERMIQRKVIDQSLEECDDHDFRHWNTKAEHNDKHLSILETRGEALRMRLQALQNEEDALRNKKILLLEERNAALKYESDHRFSLFGKFDLVVV